MIDPRNAEVFTLPLGGGVGTMGPRLEEVRLLLVRHLREIEEIAASLESAERLPEVVETVPVFMQVLRARTYTEAAAQELRKLLEPSESPG